MKKIICKKEYDTETAKVIKKEVYNTYGDPTGYEETLYQTPEGFYFMYTFGGEESKYPVEEIKRVSKANAEKML